MLPIRQERALERSNRYWQSPSKCHTKTVVSKNRRVIGLKSSNHTNEIFVSHDGRQHQGMNISRRSFLHTSLATLAFSGLRRYVEAQPEQTTTKRAGYGPLTTDPDH